MNVTQQALRFRCESSSLFGILSLPEPASARGVLIVTGGPQYRVGSHRQFALLATELARRGTPVLRFDYRGMGDSEGEMRNYEAIDADLASALAQFFEAVPALREVVLWGLCDGASAAAFYAHQDPRVCALALFNPWVRSEPGIARATLRYYYLARLREPDFWRKLVAGAVNLPAALSALRQLAGAARGASGEADGAPGAPDAPRRMFDALSRFQGRVLIVLSGDDLTAREFASLQQSTPAWRRLSAGPLVRQVQVPQANHTFARRAWRDQVAAISADWIASW